MATTSQNTRDKPTADQIAKDAHRIYSREGGETEAALRIESALARAKINQPHASGAGASRLIRPSR